MAPWLAAVAASFTALQLALVVPGSGLGWDETVYTSQVSGSVPAAFFSAPGPAASRCWPGRWPN